jgi:hypothetical protein
MTERYEEWRPIVGCEGSYEVSSHGRVRTLDRRIPHQRPGFTQRKPGVVRKASLVSGYEYLTGKNGMQCGSTS